MDSILQIIYDDVDIAESEDIDKLLINVAKECFKQENIKENTFYISLTLTNNENIKKINSKFRNINKETDVLSFPMFEKKEIEKILESTSTHTEVLGDIIISIPKVTEQAKEYGHSFERELSYMLVHGFYHLMGYDHINSDEKEQMRIKEETVLSNLKIQR